MADSLVNLQRRQKSASDLGAVVRTMKALALSNITQFEVAVESLQEYDRTISLGLYACFQQENISLVPDERDREKVKSVALVFGSDQGLVGRFNDRIYTYARDVLEEIPGEKEVWAVGERVFALLMDDGYSTEAYYNVPNSVSSITPLVNRILIDSERYRDVEQTRDFYIF